MANDVAKQHKSPLAGTNLVGLVSMAINASLQIHATGRPPHWLLHCIPARIEHLLFLVKQISRAALSIQCTDPESFARGDPTCSLCTENKIISTTAL